jgi:hypothetical protein
MAALRLHTDIRDVVDRLTAFGHAVADFDRSIESTMDDTRLLSTNLDGSTPWLEEDKIVPPGHVLFAANALRWTVEAVVDRLSQFGYQCATTSSAITASVEDLRLMSRDIDGRAPWLSADEPVTAGHLLRASMELKKPVRNVAERLLQLGFQLPGTVEITAR